MPGGLLHRWWQQRLKRRCLVGHHAEAAGVVGGAAPFQEEHVARRRLRRRFRRAQHEAASRAEALHSRLRLSTRRVRELDQEAKLQHVVRLLLVLRLAVLQRRRVAALAQRLLVLLGPYRLLARARARGVGELTPAALEVRRAAAFFRLALRGAAREMRDGVTGGRHAQSAHLPYAAARAALP